MEKNCYLKSEPSTIALAIFLISLAALAEEPQFAVKGGITRREKASMVHVELETFNDARVNAEAPISLEFKSVDGAQLARTQFTRSDFSVIHKNKLRFEIESKGSLQKANAHLVFYLCFKNTCKKIDHYFIIDG